MSFIYKLFRLICLFWVCSFAILILTMFAANLAMTHR